MESAPRSFYARRAAGPRFRPIGFQRMRAERQSLARLYTRRVMQVFAILPAAGLGTRMAGPLPKHPNDKGPSSGPPAKQFLSLDGVPILIHSLRAFASVQRVTAI